jgi:hypothetical protein
MSDFEQTQAIDVKVQFDPVEECESVRERELVTPVELPVMDWAQEPENVRMSIMERIRDSRTGRWAADLLMGAAIVVPGGVAYALETGTAGADSVPGATSTPGGSAIPSKQDCARIAEEKPKIKHPLHMVYAGIRPFTGSRHSQATLGAFEYFDMPNGCAPNEVRGVVGRIQMLRDGQWVQIENETIGGWTRSEGGVSRVIVAPTHADPGSGYLFNDCVNGKFHEVRIAIKARLRSGDPKKTAGEKDYIFPVNVQGNCSKAAQSKRVAEEQQKALYG